MSIDKRMVSERGYPIKLLTWDELVKDGVNFFKHTLDRDPSIPIYEGTKSGNFNIDVKLVYRNDNEAYQMVVTIHNSERDYEDYFYSPEISLDKLVSTETKNDLAKTIGKSIINSLVYKLGMEDMLEDVPGMIKSRHINEFFNYFK